ncbi:zinc ribbon domain-containing protein [Burkholderia dolosa]|jgi:putative FmdB family regulatory protein|uniref:Zinc ribbon domain-containing protein n=1 Tax=Burkholderia dolosa TaxID=152500 RepID=A0A892I7I7_9BURK|nr:MULTISPECIES: FmdB family zinc ribbon protein [Burkholderia]AKE02720.1 FmdB family transcriptional regulator [Burkholderia cepacia]AJY13037.1 regulatory, FmdB family domain protein [Burkholderia dolosa AU0158]AYZ97468.1 zinc ribbon domain-containing protein [Burkholderia dolosa]ETP64528.1 FmdB family transcriptional regulator [Burkholderia dolosa PC543]MBR8301038.1 zinc ribbon domain-containing protein [Burkholderia dolosa]
MPIYAYRCEACGFAKDVLQKMSDAPLSQCPECGKDAFRKQVTAAGFQLKGSGWYVTDFRGGSGGSSAPATASSGDAAPAATPAAPAASGSESTTTSAAPAPAAAPAAGG